MAENRKPLAEILITEDRQTIWRALMNGDEVYITPECRVVNRETGQDLGTQIAAQCIWFEGYAREKPGAKWVLTINKDAPPRPRA